MSRLPLPARRRRLAAAEAHVRDLERQLAELTALVQQYRAERCLPGCPCRRCRRVAELLPGLPYYPF